MLRNLNNLICCFLLLGILGGCSNPVLDVDFPEEGTGNIILKISETALPVSRATVQNAETRIDHIDVMIFKEDGSFDYHERFTNPGDGEGTLILGKARENFSTTDKYMVYLIANSDENSKAFDFGGFSPAKTLDDLKAMSQQNNDIHIVGVSADDETEDYFLMDGIATIKRDTDQNTLIQLNDSNANSNTELEVSLRRAAAKFVITLQKGDNVTFDSSEDATSAGYFIQNMPVSTSLLSGIPHSTEIYKNPGKTSCEYFNHTATAITVTGYAYSYNWQNAGLGDDVRLVVNIPMYFDDPKTDAVENEYLENNFYQVPISEAKKLDRNTCYKVTVTVNAKGGSDPSSGIELDDISYDVYEWIEVGVGVGAPGGFRPNYLSVNKELVQMYNIETDNSLIFASSSDVTVEVENYYFVDKNGVEVWRYDENGNSIEANEAYFPAGEVIGEEERTVTIDKTMTGEYTFGDWYDYNWDSRLFDQESWLIEQGVPEDELSAAITALNNNQSYSFTKKDAISVTWEDKLNGKITVNSPLPENNTIRYIILKVTNTDGSTPKYVTVEQYPLEYITPIEAWYSYRSDFYSGTDASKVTTYQTKNAGYVYTTYYNDKWNHNHSTQGYYDNPFFRSKAYDAKNTGEAKAIYYYNWQSTLNGHANLSGNVWDYAGNPRIYHVRITASSDDYTLGIPNLEEKTIGGVKLMVTDDADANALLVSPSFMIASQLGAVTSTGLTLDVAASHCAQYVEAYKVLDANGNEVIENGMVKTVDLDDWRLPTSAELYIINRFQRTRGSAIDDVLKGSNYYSASGIVNIEGQDLSKYDNIKTATGDNPEFSYSGGTAIRCIRDAY